MQGLTSAGLGKLESDLQFIELAAKYEFQCIDIDAKGLVDRLGVEAADMLKSRQLEIGAIGLPVEWRGTDEQFLSGLETPAVRCCQGSRMHTLLYIHSSFHRCTRCSFHGAGHHQTAGLCQHFGAYGIRLALEFVGPHHLRTQWKNPFIWTVQETLDWIDAIGEPNVEAAV